MPKNWNKLKLDEQESWLVKKYQEILNDSLGIVPTKEINADKESEE